MDFFLQLLCLGGIFGIRHALRQFGQLVARQLAFAGEFKSELNHARLFRGRQVLDFLNDTGGSHNPKLPNSTTLFKSNAARQWR